jgi:ABC-type antimicrobial peptide transport system permease subunit
VTVSSVDVVLDAARTCRSRPGRTIALGLAVALGVATFVGVLSMSVAADTQVAERIAALRPEFVALRPYSVSDDPFGVVDEGSLDRASAEPRLIDAAVVHTYPEADVRARWGADDEQVEIAPIMGIEGDFVGATRSTVIGQNIDSVLSESGAHVAVVGRGLANRLAMSDPDVSPTVWVDGVPFRVLGVVDDSEYLAATTDAVIVPRRTAFALFGAAEDNALYARVERGTAEQAADSLPLRLAPQAPERWQAEVPRVPLDVAEGISGDLRNLSLAMAALVMFIGVVAIGNAMMRSVYERMPEIGLRRALGAHGRHVLGLLVAESAQVGVVAGVVGVAVGLLVSVAVGARNGWPLAISGWAAAVAIPAGTAAGALGGLLPGIAAIKITPSEALRRE